MKVLLINGSPRPRGCTYTALKETEKTLNEAGIENRDIPYRRKGDTGLHGLRRVRRRQALRVR